MEKLVLAADLGGTNFRIAVVNSGGKIVARDQQNTPNRPQPDELADFIVDQASSLIHKAGGQVYVFGLSAPAVIDQEAGSVTASPNIPALNGLRLAELIQTKIGLPTILENDANAAAVGERWLGALAGVNNGICVTLGTGVGGGIILDGKLYTGANGTAGEIGHICVEPFGVPCECGSRGCVEQYASATAIIRMAEEESGGGESGSGERMTAESIYDSALGGDVAATQIFQTAGFYLGIALGGVVNMLNPEVISIGGGVAQAWDLFIEETRRQIKLRAFQQPAERVKLVRSRLGDNAGILGAARLALDLEA